MAKIKKQAPKKAPKKAVLLKKKHERESKVVKVDHLNWKPVEIPDNLGDYNGFFGLEEIDGVDVEIKNGVPQFKVKDSKSLKKQDEKVSQKQKKEKKEKQEMEVEDSEDDEEFTGFDDDEGGDHENDEEIDYEDSSENPQAETKDTSDLKENTFSMNIPLPDAEIHLPHWEELQLSDYTLNGLQALDFKKPTPIQKKAIPLASVGRDVIGKASTGSGKTLAYGIPILERCLAKIPEFEENRKKGVTSLPVGIIFAPTRELAHQVVNHLNLISKYSPLAQHQIVSITGGLSIQKQERLLKNGPGILVVTPGRCLELMEKDEELCKRLASTDIVVLDEADRLLQDGHFEEFEKILEMFRKHRPRGLKEWKWQTLVFSATFARDLFNKLDKNQRKKHDQSSLIDNDEILQLLNDKLKLKDKKPVIIDVNPKEIVSGQITEALVECGATERDLYLYYFLLMYKGTTLVFANSIDSVKRLVPFLTNLNIPAFSIHSSMIQKQRLRALERFKAASEKNEIAVLIASDVAARGLDIPNIDHVAHYHLPRSADIYIHRSGRTARAGNQGVSVMFCSPQEASGPLRKLRALVANSSGNTRLNTKSNVKLLPLEMDLINQLKPRVEISTSLADSVVSSVSTKKEDTWVKQAAEDLGIDDLSDVEDFEDDIIKKQRKRKEGKVLTRQEVHSLRHELKELLSRPIRKLMRRSYLTSGLENLAHIMVTGNTHQDVLGHKKVHALEDLKGKKTETKKFKKKPNKVTKPNKK